MIFFGIVFQVAAVPTILGVKNGKVMDQIIGDATNAQLKDFVDKLLSK